ncbi:hypothetical protein BDB01DRAFT_225351 [Pilobolus umbonatus]|nr:hypothetical protein BDB01DRAFT_225351 [Pilobolus umbonatus]
MDIWFHKRNYKMLKIGGYVKTVLEVLSVTWSVIEEFKYGKERERNKDLDDYYASLTDSLLLKVKTLHLSVLMATYDPSMMETLSSIRRLLDERYAEAKTSLDYHNEQLQKYKDLGPEFNILLKAYNNLFDRIQSTKDDIERMRSFLCLILLINDKGASL